MEKPVETDCIVTRSRFWKVCASKREIPRRLRDVLSSIRMFKWIF